ncbi:uncharacterized protein J8A68_000796 [[Candida] subhashii]|uniref:Uncharacterized protein n=1 Tax=[Candida] subhashii TaxID=561895 RepID=A0A8J5R604_9ASCO|nr:uncharacterized protein J8A68_000796 [[Candida] subhashii]KAG7665590.1 hypothetical protein J8A68_000796 [[Candida] subhashii]
MLLIKSLILIVGVLKGITADEPFNDGIYVFSSSYYEKQEPDYVSVGAGITAEDEWSSDHNQDEDSIELQPDENVKAIQDESIEVVLEETIVHKNDKRDAYIGESHHQPPKSNHHKHVHAGKIQYVTTVITQKSAIETKKASAKGGTVPPHAKQEPAVNANKIGKPPSRPPGGRPQVNIINKDGHYLHPSVQKVEQVKQKPNKNSKPSFFQKEPEAHSKPTGMVQESMESLQSVFNPFNMKIMSVVVVVGWLLKMVTTKKKLKEDDPAIPVVNYDYLNQKDV